MDERLPARGRPVIPIVSRTVRALGAIPQRLVAKWRHLRADRRARVRHRATLARLGTNKPTRVLFVCYGNICRSPLAEVLARGAFPASIEVSSAGFHDIERRPSPTNMVHAATALGASLSEHRSRRLTSDMLDRSDLILLMDHQNLRQLRETFPGHDERTAYLGPFGRSQVTVSDPYSRDEVDTLKVANQIRDAVASLASLLR